VTEILTQKRLKELLHYDPETGVFIRKIRTGDNVHVDDIAGSRHCEGYREISLCGERYLEHVLVWFYLNGEWPEDGIDHINEIRDDNCEGNLRLANHSQNGCHRGKQKNNTSGFKCVSFDKRRNNWYSYINVNGKRFYLGRYDTSEKAYAAYCEAAKKYHGEFVCL
jgi:hypothetical protein